MKHLKKTGLLFLLFCGCLIGVKAQDLTIKTNLPYLLTAAPNFGAEYAVGDRVSLELTVGANPFKLKGEKRLRHWLVCPEVRYWKEDALKGHFLGFHLLGGQYDLSGWDLPLEIMDGIKTSRYLGYAYGAGVSYGYLWTLKNNLGIEATLGIGYATFRYDIYSLGENPVKKADKRKGYIGPSKAAISFVYRFNNN
ncbi:MAG: DUF3575 domain-containing protein [Dysgonamonadaceae bacterium]|nr:DUF3575 domain-containing protein [Dysgonamonadaceae bacterium]MEA5081575.1 DUF3575 domain-containing protein [Dysgonamonadaceae bacterium]